MEIQNYKLDSSQYINWLCSKVMNATQRRKYKRLASLLHSEEFIFSVKNDINRASDGIKLREQFFEETKYDGPLDDDIYDGPCTFLEMIIALAMRIERDIMGDGTFDRTPYWFWCMLENMGINHMDDNKCDDEAVIRAVSIVNKRKYDWDGSNGGLFPVNWKGTDLRKVEIWFQANWWLNDYV